MGRVTSQPEVSHFQLGVRLSPSSENHSPARPFMGLSLRISLCVILIIAYRNIINQGLNREQWARRRTCAIFPIFWQKP